MKSLIPANNTDISTEEDNVAIAIKSTDGLNDILITTNTKLLKDNKIILKDILGDQINENNIDKISLRLKR